MRIPVVVVYAACSRKLVDSQRTSELAAVLLVPFHKILRLYMSLLKDNSKSEDVSI